MGFTVNRLSPVIGAEVIGADLSQPLGDHEFAALRRAWLDAGGVLVLRDQHLSPEQHIAFSRRFGTLEKHVLARYLLPDHPEIYRVSNKVKDGEPEGRSNAGFTSHITGLAGDESRALLDFLFRHATRPEFIYRHRWAVRDLVMWDNRCTMHHAINDYDGVGERYMHRTTVMEAE